MEGGQGNSFARLFFSFQECEQDWLESPGACQNKVAWHRRLRFISFAGAWQGAESMQGGGEAG